MSNSWQPIETAPAEPADSEHEQKQILVWVADGGNDGKGAVSFGCVYLRKSGERKPKASGYGGNHDWKITHWQPLPDAPLDVDKG